MRRIVVGLLVVACGCGGPSHPSSTPPPPPVGNSAAAAEKETPPPATETEELLCPAYGMMMLYEVGSGASAVFSSAHASATAHYSAAQTAGSAENYRAAASSYLDCARAYRAVPDADGNRSIAQENAGLCYYNAMYSFAMANVFESEGRAVLEREAKADPRLAPSINKELATPPVDCR